MSAIRVALLADVEPGTLTKVIVEGFAICLARTDDGEFYAISDICTHQAYSLSEGDLWGRELECPLHASRFNIVTGSPDQLPATEAVRTFKVNVRDGEIYVDV
jgi:3-phenylpropionate/trans-cinnamate dioxygenase ferredoxin subunit